MLLLTQTTVPKIDLTITISVIVALAAIVSPIFTTIINNRHQSKLKRMELNQKQFESTILYKRTIFENYLKYTGRCVKYSDPESLKEYGEYYFLALTYAPDNIGSLMIKINSAISHAHFDQATELFEEQAAPLISTMLKNM